MITGYFYENTEDKQQQDKQLRKAFRLTVIANLLYLGFHLLIAVMQQESAAYLKRSFSADALIRFILFNESPFGVHLWYLSALTYVLLLAKLFYKKCNRVVLACLIPVLLACDLLFGKYSLLVFGKEFPYIYVRNFLFVGLPYFLLGACLRSREKRAEGKGGDASALALFALVLLFALTTIAERYFLIATGNNGTRDHYVSTTFLAIALFLLAKRDAPIAFSQVGCRVAKIGEQYTSMIYIVHPMILTILAAIVSRLGSNAINAVYAFIKPIAAFFLAAVFAWMHERAVRRWFVKRIL